jgi:hypothetical protein
VKIQTGDRRIYERVIILAFEFHCKQIVLLVDHAIFSVEQDLSLAQ